MTNARTISLIRSQCEPPPERRGGALSVQPVPVGKRLRQRRHREAHEDTPQRRQAVRVPRLPLGLYDHLRKGHGKTSRDEIRASIIFQQQQQQQRDEYDDDDESSGNEQGDDDGLLDLSADAPAATVNIP